MLHVLLTCQRDHIVRNTPLEEVMEFLLQSTQYIESIRKETGADEDERRSRLGVIEALRNVARRADKEFEGFLHTASRAIFFHSFQVVQRFKCGNCPCHLLFGERGSDSCGKRLSS